MQQRNSQLSRNDLIDFLTFAADKGLMKKATAGAYKNACSVILNILDETEAADVSKIDLEGVIYRHRNLAAGKIPPKTLRTYEIRVRAAVSNFIEYTKDPSSWKPAVKQRARKVTKVTPPKKPKTATSAGESVEFAKHEGISRQPSVHIDFQIHISPEASPEQIDQIFASMRRHLYGSTASK